MTSDTGLQIGKTLSFDYALVPHEEDWKKAEIYRDGQEFINPLICHKSSVHKGRLPQNWSMLEVSHPNVIVTAVKPGPGGSAIVRLYEASGNATAGVTIKCRTTIKSVHEADLLEDTVRALKFDRNSVRFDLGPFEIKTLRLQLKTV